MDDVEVHREQWERRLRRRAAEQHGALGRYQLGDEGLDADHWRRLRRTGRWEPAGRRVLLLGGSVPTLDQRAMAAVLDAGPRAALHGPSALAHLGARGFDLASVHTCRRSEGNSRPPELSVLHRLRDLDDHDIVVVRGVPVVRPIRAVWSEASRYCSEHLLGIGAQRIGRIVDDLNRDGLLSLDELHHSVAVLGRRGRAGTVVMRSVADARPPGSSPTESRLEDRFEEIAVESGAPRPRRQVVIGGRRPIGRADFVADDVPLVLEVNSLAFHASPSDQAADEDRYLAFTRAGYTVAVAWETDVWSHPGTIDRLVRHARAQARGGRAVTIHSPSCPWPADPRRRVLPRPGRDLRG